MEAAGGARRAALERLMNAYGDRVLRLCYMELHDRELARDAAQETFLKAYRALDGLRGETEGAWLSRVALNACRDMRRKGWFRMEDRRVALDDLPFGADAPDSPPDKTPLEEVMRLPDKYRRVVLLCYYQGLSAENAARTLGIPAATARSRLKRARDRLREKLGEWYYDD